MVFHLFITNSKRFSDTVFFPNNKKSLKNKTCRVHKCAFSPDVFHPRRSSMTLGR